MEIERRSVPKVTPAMIQSMKLEGMFEIKGKYGINKGALVTVTRPIQVQNDILSSKMETLEKMEVEYIDVHAGDTILFVGMFFNWFDGKMYLKFIGDGRALYYDWFQHTAGDLTFGEIFKSFAGTNSTKFDL